MRLPGLIVDAFAAARIIRLVRDDAVLDRPRDRVIAWLYRGRVTGKPPIMLWQEWADVDEGRPMPVELLRCGWCLSVWAAVAVTAARRTRLGREVVAVAAVSEAAGLLDTLARLAAGSTL